MPRPQQPPTPASSTEIKGKDGSQPSLQISFELPPPAVADAESHPASASSANSSSASSYHPASPTSPPLPASEMVKTRRRSSAGHVASGKDVFALPPPPTRSRKIIQVKPREQQDEEESCHDSLIPSMGKGGAAATKKRQPSSSTSVAGRKIARKTAHSLIERRRRSKMNEEFGVLKDMIPACTGEMHKLAILQASIDYVRYLEDCVGKLKAENSRTNATPTSEQLPLPPPAPRVACDTPRQNQSFEEQEDVEMGGSGQASPAYSAPVARSNRPSASPALKPQDFDASISKDYRHCSFTGPITTSPALGPGAYEYAGSAASVGSTITSPALLPQPNPDEEATAALLMLNSDRRGINGSTSGRGMSVKDLLSA
ncbi:HLH, helix-loop-helix DNA-binding protein [Diplocarpon rosae]|nr:HLH, helix-loop-helix DNA-binding protein [Diplocarpon rosae]